MAGKLSHSPKYTQRSRNRPKGEGKEKAREKPHQVVQQSTRNRASFSESAARTHIFRFPTKFSSVIISLGRSSRHLSPQSLHHSRIHHGSSGVAPSILRFRKRSGQRVKGSASTRRHHSPRYHPQARRQARSESAAGPPDAACSRAG